MSAKKIIISVVAICLGLGLFAQQSPIPNNPYYDNKPYHFGILFGTNRMDFRVEMKENFKNDTLYDARSSGYWGFTAGPVINLKLHKYWDLRFVPTISLGTRHLTYFLHEGPNQVRQVTKNIESTTADIPLEVKWKGMRARSIRPYVIGGIRYSWDMASNAKKKQQNQYDIDEIVVKLKKHDFQFTTGVGFDFYAPFGNKFAIEIKMGFGLNDILVHENNIFANGIDRLSSKNLQIAITFE